jgi:hypothetical protein
MVPHSTVVAAAAVRRPPLWLPTVQFAEGTRWKQAIRFIVRAFPSAYGFAYAKGVATAVSLVSTSETRWPHAVSVWQYLHAEVRPNRSDAEKIAYGVSTEAAVRTLLRHGRWQEAIRLVAAAASFSGLTQPPTAAPSVLARQWNNVADSMAATSSTLAAGPAMRCLGVAVALRAALLQHSAPKALEVTSMPDYAVAEWASAAAVCARTVAALTLSEAGRTGVEVDDGVVSRAASDFAAVGLLRVTLAWWRRHGMLSDDVTVTSRYLFAIALGHATRGSYIAAAEAVSRDLLSAGADEDTKSTAIFAMGDVLRLTTTIAEATVSRDGAFDVGEVTAMLRGRAGSATLRHAAEHVGQLSPTQFSAWLPSGLGLALRLVTYLLAIDGPLPARLQPALKELAYNASTSDSYLQLTDAAGLLGLWSVLLQATLQRWNAAPTTTPSSDNISAEQLSLIVQAALVSFGLAGAQLGPCRHDGFATNAADCLGALKLAGVSFNDDSFAAIVTVPKTVRRWLRRDDAWCDATRVRWCDIAPEEGSLDHWPTLITALAIVNRTRVDDAHGGDVENSASVAAPRRILEALPRTSVVGLVDGVIRMPNDGGVSLRAFLLQEIVGLAGGSESARPVLGSLLVGSLARADDQDVAYFAAVVHRQGRHPAVAAWEALLLAAPAMLNELPSHLTGTLGVDARLSLLLRYPLAPWAGRLVSADEVRRMSAPVCHEQSDVPRVAELLQSLAVVYSDADPFARDLALAVLENLSATEHMTEVLTYCEPDVLHAFSTIADIGSPVGRHLVAELNARARDDDEATGEDDAPTFAVQPVMSRTKATVHEAQQYGISRNVLTKRNVLALNIAHAAGDPATRVVALQSARKWCGAQASRNEAYPILFTATVFVPLARLVCGKDGSMSEVHEFVQWVGSSLANTEAKHIECDATAVNAVAGIVVQRLLRGSATLDDVACALSALLRVLAALEAPVDASSFVRLRLLVNVVTHVNVVSIEETVTMFEAAMDSVTFALPDIKSRALTEQRARAKLVPSLEWLRGAGLGREQADSMFTLLSALRHRLQPQPAGSGAPTNRAPTTACTVAARLASRWMVSAPTPSHQPTAVVGGGAGMMPLQTDSRARLAAFYAACDTGRWAEALATLAPAPTTRVRCRHPPAATTARVAPATNVEVGAARVRRGVPVAARAAGVPGDHGRDGRGRRFNSAGRAGAIEVRPLDAGYPVLPVPRHCESQSFETPSRRCD